MEFTAEMIASLLGGEVVGDKNVVVSTVSSIEEGKSGSLAYLTNIKYESYLYSSQASIVIVDNNFEPSAPVHPTLIKVENATAALVKLLEIYNAAINKRRTGIASMSSISQEADVAPDIYVGEFSVIERGAKIGGGCQIYPQCFIGEGVTIGEGTTIYPGVKIYRDCHIGKNCIIHAGAVIGADGFGFALKEDGSFDKIPQLGNVIIEDEVEIGANTCIDRAKTDATIICRGVKLDNLIQVAHNVRIGENTVSSAQMGIAGSSSIGSNCFLGGKVGIIDHVKIGNNCKVGSMTGISSNVPDGESRVGFFPSQPGLKFHRMSAVMKNLPELVSKVRDLEKELKGLKELK
ncbi:MAG: UDP-3-O-(3-hydroxymyristoyl)glucosamine N-acyltransferase [Rikenellaceae bacterium]